MENIEVHVASRMSTDYLQNMKLIHILGLPPKYFNITSHNWLENWVLKITKYCFYQCAAHPKSTTFFNIIRVLFLPANYTTQPQPYIWESSMRSNAITESS
jgi:hypothetical protein